MKNKLKYPAQKNIIYLSKKPKEEVADIREATLLLASKIWTLEKAESIYMWDEVISYLERGREVANRNPEEKGA